MSREEIVIGAFVGLMTLMGFLCGWMSRAVWVLNACGVHTL